MLRQNLNTLEIKPTDTVFSTLYPILLRYFSRLFATQKTSDHSIFNQYTDIDVLGSIIAKRNDEMINNMSPNLVQTLSNHFSDEKKFLNYFLKFDNGKSLRQLTDDIIFDINPEAWPIHKIKLADGLIEEIKNLQLSIIEEMSDKTHVSKY